ncbi:DUF2391 family protein [Thermococcus zilligii]|uniref:DUF2391 family protein n=1 Tax=Thermococcus zilligii TaxID=54076 RepID=UPI00029A2124
MMSESNAEGMMSPEPELKSVDLKEINENLDSIRRQLDELQKEQELEKTPDKLGWDDIAQELVGAITFALPFLFTSELWDVAKDISIERSFAIFLLTLGVAYIFIAKSRIGNLKHEDLFHVPKRLITVSLISYTISAGLIYLYGINDVANFSTLQYINATAIVSTFAMIGAIAVDMVT